MLWKELLSCEFKEAVKRAKGICAIPIGCVERHGDHLPLGCDTIWGAEFTRRAAEEADVVVFPEMYFGEKSGAGEYPGTIIFPTTLIWQILEHSCYEIARNGFHKIVLLSSHGGNKAMLEAFARQILQKKPAFQVFVFQYGLPSISAMLEHREDFPYLTEEDLACLENYVEEKKKGGHGCFSETACCVDTCPELCRLENMDRVDGKSQNRIVGLSDHSLYSPFVWMANYPNSLTADFHKGMNERIARAIGSVQTKKAADMFRFLKEENATEEYHRQWLNKQ